MYTWRMFVSTASLLTVYFDRELRLLTPYRRVAGHRPPTVLHGGELPGTSVTPALARVTVVL